ncbi:MAG: hypothetical protein B7X57_03750, partial [Erythrobacter sp. 34-65-8]
MATRAFPALLLLAALVGCGSARSETSVVPASETPAGLTKPAFPDRPAPGFTRLDGERTQGGWLRGIAPAGTVE